ncbi:unnamed protein product, partial [Amoebophrya sp. A25]|eukprot:GSA25T00007445001.1
MKMFGAGVFLLTSGFFSGVLGAQLGGGGGPPSSASSSGLAGAASGLAGTTQAAFKNGSAIAEVKKEMLSAAKNFCDQYRFQQSDSAPAESRTITLDNELLKRVISYCESLPNKVKAKVLADLPDDTKKERNRQTREAEDAFFKAAYAYFSGYINKDAASRKFLNKMIASMTLLDEGGMIPPEWSPSESLNKQVAADRQVVERVVTHTGKSPAGDAPSGGGAPPAACPKGPLLCQSPCTKGISAGLTLP